MRLKGDCEGGISTAVHLEKLSTDGIWEVMEHGAAPDFDFYLFLDPGDYRVRAITGFSINEADVQGLESYSYVLQVGDLVLGDYTNPALGSDWTDPSRSRAHDAANSIGDRSRRWLDRGDADGGNREYLGRTVGGSGSSSARYF